MEPLPAPPALQNINISEIDSYTCSNCSSSIKLISIDEKKMTISFECLNEDSNNNHHIQSMPINEYIKKMIINTYLFSKCSICKTIQISINNSPFNYCLNCKEIICNDCKEKHLQIKKDNSGHFFIKNKERNIKCLNHSENNNCTEYCVDCKKNICKECLKTRKHITHHKYALEEILLLEENKLNHKKIIDLLKKEKNILEEQKQSIINGLNDKINDDITKLDEKYENENKEFGIKLKNDIELKNNKLKMGLKELKQKYLNDVQSLRKQIENEKNIIIQNFDKEYKKRKKSYNEELSNIKSKHINNNLLCLDKKLNNLLDLIRINEILRKTQEKNENNFFNNENINKAIECFQNSENIEIKKISIKNIELQKMETFKPNDIYISIQNDDKKFLSKKTKFEKNEIQLQKINIQGQIQNNFKNKLNYINNIKNRNININLKEEDEVINISNEINNKSRIKEKFISQKKNYDLNYISYDIIKDSFCPIEIDNSFVIFESKKCSYIVYATIDKSIISYNLSNKKIDKKINNAHNEHITNFYYCYNNIINKELIMSISYKDTNLKIWNFKTWDCILNIQKVYSQGFIYAACFLNKQNNFYFVTSNYEENKFTDSIKIFDYNQNIIKVINGSEFNVFSIKVLYNNEDTYIIASNENNIKSYNYDKSELFLKYQDNFVYCKIKGFTVFIGGNIKKLIASCDDYIIRIWDFFTSKMISKVKINSNRLRSLCLMKEHNLLIGCDDNEIQFLDLCNFNKIKSLNQHKEGVFYIKKKYLKDLASCIISQGHDNQIIIWKLIGQ